MRKLIFILSFVLFSTFASAHLLDSLALDSAQTYTSINQALNSGNLSQVYKLDLHHQKLTKLPETILKFKNLQYLDLSKNKFKVLPPEIAQLTNLQFLSLEDNKKLDSIPPYIGKLTHLKKLILNRTAITSLPSSMGNLKSLAYLDLWGTAVTYFPPSMRELKNLKNVDMRVVLYSDSKKTLIRSRFPKGTNIDFTKGCSCGF